MGTLLQLSGPVFLFILLVHAVPKEDQVTSLPGMTWTPSFRHYSGFLDASDDKGKKDIHYWLVESQGNPRRDPLIVWLNEGPGCSSMIAMLTEHGPFTLLEDGKTIEKNPYAWNKFANIIYLEVPASTGYSFANDYEASDSSVPKTLMKAMSSFYEKFPAFKDNDFYIAVEGYSGKYAVMAATNILANSSSTLNFKGLLINNGVTPRKTSFNALLYSIYYRGFIAEEQWNNALNVCCHTTNTSRCDFYTNMYYNACLMKIADIVEPMDKSFMINPYNMYLPVPGGIPIPPKTRKNSVSFAESHDLLLRSTFSVEDTTDRSLKFSRNTKWSCRSRPLQYLTNYLRRFDVQSTLHVQRTQKSWNPENEPQPYVYDTTAEVIDDCYKKIIGNKTELFLMFGDLALDNGVLAAKWFIKETGLPQVKKGQSWFYNDPYGYRQFGGFTEQAGNIHLYTVKGAGMRTAQDAPLQAFEVFKSFFKKQ